MSDPVLVDRQDGVLLVTLNRPETRNAISGGDVIDLLAAVMAQASEDRSVRALVMTGAGTAFSSGGNIKDMTAKAGMFGGGPAAPATAIATASSGLPAPSTTARCRPSPR